MRIIIGSAGAQSDLMFIFALAKELQHRSHVVTLVVPEKYRSYIMKMEVRMVTCGRSFEEYLEGNPGEFQTELAKSLASQVASQFVSLRDALRESDVFVSGTFLVPAASMAEKLNLPFFQVIQSPLLLNPDEFPLQGIPLEKVSGFLSGRKKASIREEWEDTIGKILNKERSFTHLEPVHNLYRQMYAYGHQIVAVDPEFSEIENVPNRSVSGYFKADSLIEQSVPGFDEGKRKIFISPLHLAQSEREPFLQSLSASLAELDCQVVVRSDWTGGQDKQLPGNCVAIEPSFETAVMSQSAVVIHQGAGANVMTCARAGVPQVIIPFLVDHAFWAERVEALKLGPEPLDKIEPKAVAGAVSKALNIRDSASVFAEKKRDQNGITAACDVIESIAGKNIAG
jgi:UDP:flavonoid glycosyltransferase YjiC (YdhE family)